MNTVRARRLLIRTRSIRVESLTIWGPHRICPGYTGFRSILRFVECLPCSLVPLQVFCIQSWPIPILHTSTNLFLGWHLGFLPRWRRRPLTRLLRWRLRPGLGTWWRWIEVLLARLGVVHVLPSFEHIRSVLCRVFASGRRSAWKVAETVGAARWRSWWRAWSRRRWPLIAERRRWERLCATRWRWVC